MHRINITGIFLLMLFLGSHTVSAQNKRPNILWLVIEDTSPQFIGCYGNSQAKTPNIDALAKQGIRFSNAFSTGTVCSPSRSAIITGVRTYELGTGNHRSNYPLPDFIKGFPYYLRQAGYYTSNNKKTDYNTSSAGRITREAWHESSGKAGWWNREPGQPFFAVFNFEDSHQSRTMTNPYYLYQKQVLELLPEEKQVAAKDIAVPPFFRDSDSMRKQLARIYNGIGLADHRIGKVLDSLRKDHLLDSTIIFFYADHGEGMPRAKTNGIDLGHRVPFIVWFPEMYKHLSPWGTGGTVSADLVCFADLAPTLLQLAGATIPGYMKGRVLLSKNATPAPGSMLLSSDGSEGVSELCRTVTNGRYSYTRVFMPFMPELFYKKYFDYSDIMQLMRADLKNNLLGKEQKAPFEERSPEYLFDISKDPWQMHNLAEDPAFREVVAQMRAEMNAGILRDKDVLFLPEYELARISEKSTPYVFREDSTRYPVRQVLDAASLSGLRSPDALKRQVALLGSPQPYVRYWAALGLKSQGAAVKAYARQLKAALKDNYPPARVVLASVCYDLLKDGEAEAILNRAIGDDNMHLSRLAIQMAQYQQHRNAFVPAVTRVITEVEQKKRKPGAREAAEMFLYSVKGAPLHYNAFW
ncbi:sulfatase-like hydrolase/transferase [Chitinophaga alhagiae]|uniref:sulfatase-like hydrolase/transferase n=1 Tax=Chitinophaga alhagiae TaxID=2203219 RepID=UPI000E5BD19A|nr:sulfatase-like hydrolase/transferase [Chitinophaga alhagiae]